MTTPGEIGQYVEMGLKVGGFVAELVLRFIDGDDSEPVRQAVDVLPPEMRSDINHLRQKRALELELREDLRMDAPAQAERLAARFVEIGAFDEATAAQWARATLGLELPPPNPFDPEPEPE